MEGCEHDRYDFTVNPGCVCHISDCMYNRIMSNEYRQKPIIVKAWRWNGDQNLSGAPDWIQSAYETGKIQITSDYKDQTYMTIYKTHGNLRVYSGDYVIKGVQGGIYPCKADTFHAAHESVQNNVEKD